MSTINSLGGSAAWASAGTQRSDRPPGGPDPSQFKQDLFKKLDADSSGGIDSGEIGDLLTQIAQRSGSSQAAGSTTAFGQMDSNSDGSLAADELDTGLKKLLGGGSDTVSFARSRGAGGPPPGAPSGPPPGPPPDAASATSSSDSSTASTDPLDTNGDGTVSASERAAGEIQQALKDLLKAVDSDGDAKVSRQEANQFAEVLKQMSAQGSGNSSGNSSSGQSGTGRDQADGRGNGNGNGNSANDLAEQVLRHYSQASDQAQASARANRLSVAA